MRKFPEPMQESVVDCENMDIGPFRKGPKQITTILTFHCLINSAVEALRF